MRVRITRLGSWMLGLWLYVEYYWKFYLWDYITRVTSTDHERMLISPFSGVSIASSENSSRTQICYYGFGFQSRCYHVGLCECRSDN